jgi:hypothetical protein
VVPSVVLKVDEYDAVCGLLLCANPHNKTFRETFGSHDMSKQLELYTDYYNPNSSGNSSGRTGKRKRED